MMCCAVLQGMGSRYMGAVPGAAIRLSTLLAGRASSGRAREQCAKDGESRGGGSCEEVRWHWAGKEGEDGDVGVRRLGARDWSG